MSETYILALDQGTTSSRAILFDHSGRACHTAQCEYSQHYPTAGQVEQDAEEIWATQQSVMSQVVAQAEIPETALSDRIAALGITNQRESVVVWDRQTGTPICRSINWQDRRTSAYCQELKTAGHEQSVREKTGLRLDPYFSATKLRWILENVPDARLRAERGELCFGTIDTWLIWNLTDGQVHATDASNASRTLLYNIHQGCWDRELLELFEIPSALLPEVRETSGHFGKTAQGIPIAGVAGDQQAALFGQACFAPGMAKNTYGTGCFLLMQTGEQARQSQHNLLTTIAWQIDGVTSYALEGSVFTAGAAVQWLRDGIGIISHASECEQLALQVSDNGGMTFIPAFSGLGAPYWCDSARGTFVGMTAGTNRSHLCRATLEAVALQVHDLVDCMQADAGVALAELRCDGGMTQSGLLMQLQSDLIGTPVVLPQEQEVTALGAAYLAGLAVGFWSSQTEIAQQWQVSQTHTPTNSTTQLKTQWRTAIAHLTA